MMSSDGDGQNRVGVRGGLFLPGKLIHQRSLILVGLLFAPSVVPVLSVETRTMGRRILDSLSRRALASLGRITYLLFHHVVLRSLVCARYLRVDDWLLRSEPNSRISSGRANLCCDGVSGGRGLPVSGLVGRRA